MSFNKQVEMHEYQGHGESDHDVVAEQAVEQVSTKHHEDKEQEQILVVEPPLSPEPFSEHVEQEQEAMPHGEVGAPAAELARNLPELVEQLKRLRMEMEKCNKLYETINLGYRASGKMGGSDDMMNAIDEQRMYASDQYGRESDAYTTTNKMSVASRDTFFDNSRPSYMDEYDHQAPNFGPPVGVTASSFRASSTSGLRRSQQLHKLPRPSIQGQRMPSMSAMNQIVSYTVMWVSGECGISLRNFSTNKIGAQIAVLQQADGVTTGISNCRLGDQLVTVNDDRVEDLRFKEIVQKLKSTRRPITLGFRMNQNVQTSPTASSRSTVGSLSGGGAAGAGGGGAGGSRSSSSRSFFSGGEDEYGSASHGASILDQAIDRQTYSSMRSSTSTVSDDVEIFCKEQEEMHSDLIMLLTDTVMRCENLQQENLDQLQNLMQLAPNLQTNASSSSRGVDDAMCQSSLAPVASPELAASYAKLRASGGEMMAVRKAAATISSA